MSVRRHCGLVAPEVDHKPVAKGKVEQKPAMKGTKAPGPIEKYVCRYYPHLFFQVARRVTCRRVSRHGASMANTYRTYVPASQCTKGTPVPSPNISLSYIYLAGDRGNEASVNIVTTITALLIMLWLLLLLRLLRVLESDWVTATKNYASTCIPHRNSYFIQSSRLFFSSIPHWKRRANPKRPHSNSKADHCAHTKRQS